MELILNLVKEELTSDDQIKNQIQKAYVGINENLEKAKREIVTDENRCVRKSNLDQNH